jgi:hypothetical protein
MFSRPFYPDHFLRSVYGTESFGDYCRDRKIPFEQGASASAKPGDCRRWTAALSQLPHDRHAQVEMELATVNEMAGADGTAHLLEAAGEMLPPESVPRGAALSLWYFLHHPAYFHEVFFHHEIRDVESWRTAEAPPAIALPDLPKKAAALGDALCAFFRLREGAGRFCTVEAHALPSAVCFVGQVADRLQFVDAFTDSGRPARRTLRRALPILFVYYPHSGTVLLKCHLRAQDRVTELFGRFGEAVLGSPALSRGDAFDLDLLKRPFHPQPDAPDMGRARVKALHLRYCDAAGRRHVMLDTLSSDAPDAIDHLLRTHVPDAALERLRVSYAEIQVPLLIAGRGKHYLIRLWPDRCNLSRSPLGERLYACLRRWGLTHAQF